MGVRDGGERETWKVVKRETWRDRETGRECGRWRERQGDMEGYGKNEERERWRREGVTGIWMDGRTERWRRRLGWMDRQTKGARETLRDTEMGGWRRGRYRDMEGERETWRNMKTERDGQRQREIEK